MNFLLVFIGGGLGSLCRYGIAVLMKNSTSNFPYATFWANAISCIILGGLVAYTLKKGAATDVQKLFLMTGFCGGFSTFSTFTNETFQLLQRGEYAVAGANMVVSMVVCLFCIFLGMKIFG